MVRTHGLGLIVALLLSACATKAPVPVNIPAPSTTEPGTQSMTPKMAANADYLTRMAAAQERLYAVAAPLLINNAELCRDKARNVLGFTAKNRFSYPGEYNEAAHMAFGMGDQMQVTGVLNGSGAARAGLKRGDILVAAEGKQMPTGANAPNLAGSVLGPLAATHSNIDITIGRGGSTRNIPVPVTRACGFGIELGNADNINAYADGSRILITRGMLAFVQSNDELAYVMAKTMAHNMLGHAASMRQTQTLDSMIDNLVAVKPDTSLLIGTGGIKPVPDHLDIAADNLAIYLLARAGYNIDGADDFWKRLAAAHPASVLNGYVHNHPSTATRIAAIQKAIADVKAKQSAKKPLVP